MNNKQVRSLTENSYALLECDKYCTLRKVVLRIIGLTQSRSHESVETSHRIPNSIPYSIQKSF